MQGGGGRRSLRTRELEDLTDGESNAAGIGN